MRWRFRDREIDLTSRGVILGIVNVTPDSFSDGGRTSGGGEAVDHALHLLRQGADILDIGGESTRPGAMPVSAEEEMARVIPVIRRLRELTDAPISIDTSKATVAERALASGADIVNDVSALGDPAMGREVARARAGLILMHMQGTPRSMQESPEYADVVTEVGKFLSDRRATALACGVDSDAIILDPGLGFGKTPRHNLSLLAGIPALFRLGAPVLIGHSRKSFLGLLAGEKNPDYEARLHPAVAITALAHRAGARLFRVHDPAPHRAALRASEAFDQEGETP